MPLEKVGDVVSGVVGEINKNQNKQEEDTTQKQMVVEKREANVLTSTQALELSLVFNTTPEERKQGWCKRIFGKDKHIEARAVIPSKGKEPDLLREEDLNTLISCFLMLKHARVKPNKHAFETSYYQMTKIIEKGHGGQQHEDLKRSLSRLTSNILTTNFWWDTILGKRIKKMEFHFLGSVAEGEQETLRVALDPNIAKSLEEGYLKLLEENDLKQIVRLRGHTKVLALFLLQLIGHKPEQTLNLETVLKYLGLEGKYNKLPKKHFNLNVKRTVEPAVKKACEIFGYTSTYSKEKKQFHIQRKTRQMELPLPMEKLPGAVEQEETKKEPPEGLENREYDPVLKQRRNNAFKALTRIGVDENAIGKIFEDIKQEKLSLELVERQLEWFSYREKDSNPPGLFMSALYENWIMPAAYEKTREEILITRS